MPLNIILAPVTATPCAVWLYQVLHLVRVVALVLAGSETHEVSCRSRVTRRLRGERPPFSPPNKAPGLPPEHSTLPTSSGSSADGDHLRFLEIPPPTSMVDADSSKPNGETQGDFRREPPWNHLPMIWWAWARVLNVRCR
eukprot:6472882-Amphidinium_carterae.1